MNENNIPAMKSKMQIVHLELIKEAPSIMGLFQDKNKDIFHATCYPITLLTGHENGWKKLHELGLADKEDYSDKIAEAYGENMETFKTIIPMTRHTVELNNYEPGSKIILNIKPMPLVEVTP